MANADGQYYQFHIPLGLYDAIQMLQRTDTGSGVPTLTQREWFSQPRPAYQGEMPKPTFFYATANANMFDLFGTGIGSIGGNSILNIPNVVVSLTLPAISEVAHLAGVDFTGLQATGTGVQGTGTTIHLPTFDLVKKIGTDLSSGSSITVPGINLQLQLPGLDAVGKVITDVGSGVTTALQTTGTQISTTITNLVGEATAVLGGGTTITIPGLDLFKSGIEKIGGGTTLSVPGLNGKTYTWDGAPGTDPFPDMVDTTYWNVQRVQYSSAAFPALGSIAEGAQKVVAAIAASPGKFALGGYGMGAAMMARVYQEIQYGSLQNRQTDLIGGVMFGSPAREAGHLWVGAPAIGSWDAPSTTTGNHGAFPVDWRMSGTPSTWWDFANADDIFASVGNTSGGVDEVALIGLLTQTFGGSDLISFLTTNLTHLPWTDIGGAVSLLTQLFATMGKTGGGHSTYPTSPPTGNPQNGLTSYQIALGHLTTLGQEYAKQHTSANRTEVLQINFKLPMPINDLGFLAVQVPVKIEAWYKDRYDNWRPMLDDNRSPVVLNLTRAAAESWYGYRTNVSPVVAKAMQLRLTRVYDAQVGNKSYCVGIKELLIRRNIYSRPAGIQSTTITEDTLGNVIETTIKDWEPPKAIDNNPATFWKCQPQPDPNAVVYLILDVRGSDGSAQLIDTLYIDPVYTGNALNLYYSNDSVDTTLALSPISVTPNTAPAGVRWEIGKGIWDTNNPSIPSTWYAPFSIGPLVKKDCWIGIEWTPNFDTADAPADDCVLFEVVPTDPQPGQVWPRIFYDVSAHEVVLEFRNATTVTHSFASTFNTAFGAGEPLRIVAGWMYNAPGESVCVSVRDHMQIDIASYAGPTSDVPDYVTLDGEIGFSGFQGLFTAHVIKLDRWDRPVSSREDFQANPTFFCDPEPTIPNSQGVVGSSSLDNAVLSCDWLSQKTPIGGSHPTAHADRRWTPVWRDYVTQRGKMFLPRQIMAQYLKLEFTNLTPEPYPVYDTHIQVTYDTFPVSVYADYTSTTSTNSTDISHVPGIVEKVVDAGTSVVGAAAGVATGVTSTITNMAGQGVGAVVNGVLGTVGDLVGGIAHVNWLDPKSVTAALNSTFTIVTKPITALLGASNPIGSLPNTLFAAVQQVSNAVLPLTTGLTSLLTGVSSGISVASGTQALSAGMNLPMGTANKTASPAMRGGVISNLLGNGAGAFSSTALANTLSNSLTGLSGSLTSAVSGLTNSVSTLMKVPSTSVVRQEMTSPIINRRPLLDIINLAAQSVNTLLGSTVKQAVEAVIPPTLVKAVQDTFTPVVNTAISTIESILPKQGTDSWMFPGGLMKLPATVMTGLTGLTDTVLGYNTSKTTTSTTSTTTRVRFETTETHIYRKLVATRDAAIGYFAGVREVAAYATAYIPDEDALTFNFDLYNESQWYPTNIKTTDVGAVSESGYYTDAKLGMVTDLDYWNLDGNWSWENSQDDYTGNRTGAALCLPDGTTSSIDTRNPFPVRANEELLVTGWIKHAGVLFTNMASNSGFEDDNYLGTAPGVTYSDDQSRHGSRSLKIVASGSNPVAYLHGDGASTLSYTGVPGDVFYLEIWVYGKSTNTQTTGGTDAIRLGVSVYNGGDTHISDEYVSLTASSTNLNGVWTKLSGTVTLPLNTATFTPYVGLAAEVTNGEIYYFDDFVHRTPSKIVMDVLTYDSNDEVSGSSPLTPIPSTTSGVDASIVSVDFPRGNTDGATFTQVLGTYTVPTSGVAKIGVRYRLLNVEAGEVWVTGTKVVTADPSMAIGTLSNNFRTTSTFSKVVCDFRDSGLMRSDAMWARMDPIYNGPDRTKLAWYVRPSTMPPGMWGDTFAAWADQNVKWGTSRAKVAIIVDPNRMYQGNRVLRFMRASGAGEAGVSSIQRTNYVSNSLARIGCVFYKPQANANTIQVRLRRVSDGVYVYGGTDSEGIIAEPAVGQWVTYTTPFFDIPDSLDQTYQLEFYTMGDTEEDLFLSDLYTEVTHVRYHMQLGGPTGYLHDVTAMAHSTSDAIVTSPMPVNEMSIDVTLLSDRVAAHGCTITPVYLK